MVRVMEVWVLVRVVEVGVMVRVVEVRVVEVGVMERVVEVVVMEEVRDMWNRCSDRVMSIKLMYGKDTFNIISAYAPQTGCSIEEKEDFWQQMDA
ncbi:hypothetical protein Pcinc_004232 [Petrolisthes cinctipes]|uniref:Uncharacterized protein n=1 Tax=Petrolisthes cinctipes TaxID=88211 RepID=A0AAE1GHC5_PETCI|nr:hypothetical protein Pcinc_004232 [Petrolisthes cinctipes]